MAPQPLPTYILQHQAEQPAFNQPSLSHQHPSFQPHVPTPINQAAHWYGSSQEMDASQTRLPTQPDLKQQLDCALRKIREYEDTILHQATLSRQFFSLLRTQHGVICPDCKQEVAHVCSTPYSLVASSSLQRPLNRYEHDPPSTLGNPIGLQAYTTGLTPPFGEHVPSQVASSIQLPSGISNPSTSITSRNPFGEHVPSQVASSIQLPSGRSNPSTPITSRNPAGLQAHVTFPAACGNLAVHGNLLPASTFDTVQPPPPSSSDIHPYFFPPVTSSSGATSSCPPLCTLCPSTSTNSQHVFSNCCFGKRDPPCADLDGEPERKKARQNSPEQRDTNQRRKYPPSQCPTTSNSFLPSSKVPSLPPSALKATMPSSAPNLLPTPPEASEVGSEQQFEENWCITYNHKVKREIDVKFVRPLYVGRDFVVLSLKFSKDGKYLAVGSADDGTTNIYDVQTGRKTCTLRDIINGKEACICGLLFSPDGLCLATMTCDIVYIWEISKKHVRNIFTFPHDLIICIDLSPDGRLLAVSSLEEDEGVSICSMQDGARRILKYPMLEESESWRSQSLCFSPDGRYIVVGRESGNVLIQNARSGQMLKMLLRYPSRVRSLAFTPDGAGLIMGSFDGTIKFWDISWLGADGSRLQPWQNAMDTGPGEALLNFRGHDYVVEAVAVSSNNRWVLSCSGGQSICIWDAHNGELLCELFRRHHYDGTDFSPVTSCIASYEDGKILLWRYVDIL